MTTKHKKLGPIDAFTEKASDEVFRYPKFTFLLLMICFAYFLYDSPHAQPTVEFFRSLGYVGIFLLGFFFAYGFTAPPATAVFMQLSGDVNIYAAALLGGIGAYLGDFLIYLLIRQSFKNEIRKLQHEKVIQHFNMKIPQRFRKTLFLAFAGIVIASPLPDELGVALLASSTSISKTVFALVSVTFNTIGIFASLFVGSLL